MSLRKSPEKKRIEELERQVASLNAKQQALLIERDFWVEQGRSLQNHLQTWQGMYSKLFDQLGRGVVTEQDLTNNLAMVSHELQQPIATVEAVRALTASMNGVQGQYTSVYANQNPAIR